MNNEISTIFSNIGDLWWLFYILITMGGIFMAGAVINFRKQLNLMSSDGIVNPQLREMVESNEVTPPPYWLYAVINCVISGGAIYAAIAMKFPNL